MSRGVSQYLRDGPFADFAGRLGRDTGKEDFVSTKEHDNLLRDLEDNLLQNEITIRLLVAGVGGGKTWTLSWFFRHFFKSKDTFVIGIPRIELRGQPDRGFMEAIFRALQTNDQLEEIRQRLKTHQIPQGLVGKPTHYVWNALNENDAYASLSGGGGRLPVLNNIPPPLLTKTEGTLQLLLGLFRILYTLGYGEVVILVDEIESLFVAYGKRDLFIFENYLRGIFDEFLYDRGQYLPRLLILLAGTNNVLEEISPALVGKPSGSGDFAQALARRLGPMVFLVKDKSDVLRIAKYRIGEHRKLSSNKPFIPYDEDAILYVWDNSLGSIGDFCHYLHRMYELALSENAERITIEYAKRTIEQYQAASSVSSAENSASTPL